jgi:hypothetical protein
MKHFSVAFAIVVSLLLGFLGAGTFVLLAPLVHVRLAFNIVWLLVGLVYLWIFLKVPPLCGSLRALDLVVMLCLIAMGLICSSLCFLLSATVSFWLMRALRCQREGGWLCIDFMITLIAVVLAVTIWVGSHDFFSTLWVFMLAQSVLFFVPQREEVAKCARVPDFDMAFARACRQAERALAKLSRA